MSETAGPAPADTGKVVRVAGEPAGARSFLQRNLTSIAVLAAGVFALLWLGAEVTIARLERELASLKPVAGNAFAAAPAAADAPRPAQARPVSGPRRLTDEQREAMLQLLYEQTSEKRAWLIKASSDPESASYAEALAGVFRAAGWTIDVAQWSAGTLKPGVRIFVGPEQPTPSAELVTRALEASGAAPQQFTGYRAYREERMRADPSAGGIDLAQDQDFVIVVGRAE